MTGGSNTTNVCSFIAEVPITAALGYDNTLSNLIIAATCIFGVIYGLVFLRRKDKEVFRIYSNFVTFLVIVLVFTVVLRMLPVPESNRSFILFADVFRALLISCQWLIQLGVVLFVYERSPVGPSVVTSTARALAGTVLLLAIWVIFLIVDADAFIGHIISECLLVSFFLLSLLLVNRTFRAAVKIPTFSYNARPVLRIWAGFQLITHLAFGTVYTLQFAVGAGPCITSFVDWIYYILLVPILCHCVKKDSSYWREKGAMLQMIHNISMGDLENDAEQVQQIDGVPYIHWEEIELLEKIGSGGFADVFHGRWQGSDVAIKQYRMEKGEQDGVDELLKESRLLLLLTHPQIVRIMGISVGGSLQGPISSDNLLGEVANKGIIVCCIMEYAQRGSLWKLLRTEPDTFSPNYIYSIALDIARGMEYLHKQGILHRDLKSSNVLVKQNGRAIICDFGISKASEVSKLATMTVVGTPQWTAPEVLRGDRYNYKADVYSYGVILYELVEKNHPFANRGPEVMIQVAFEGLRPRIEIDTDVDEVFVELFEHCIGEDRPDFTQVIHVLEQL